MRANRAGSAGVARGRTEKAGKMDVSAMPEYSRADPSSVVRVCHGNDRRYHDGGGRTPRLSPLMEDSIQRRLFGLRYLLFISMTSSVSFPREHRGEIIKGAAGHTE
jgi:hypothetical protein